MIFTAIFSVLVFYLLGVVIKRWSVLVHLKKTIPSPPTHPFTGVILNMPKDPPGILQYFTDQFKKLGKNVILPLFMYESLIFISDPDDVEAILSNPNFRTAKKSDNYDMLVPWLGTGLLISWGEKWFTRRKIITPSFHFSILEQFVDVFNRQSDIFVKKLSKFDGKEEFDVYTDVTHFTLDVICEASMGIKMNAQSEPNSDYATAVKEYTSILDSKRSELIDSLFSISVLLHKRNFHIFKNYRVLFELVSQQKRGEKQLLEIMHGFTKKVIAERRKILLQNGNVVDEDSGRKKKKSFLDMLLHATVNGQKLSDEDIREEVDTFMFEGHDTTASGVAFGLYHLSQNQKVQEKMLEELKDVLGKDCADKSITYNDLNELKYLDLIVKETMRITPPVPFIGRALTEDTKLGGTMVPRGQQITLAIYHMHSNPEHFPDPEKFDPDRFLEQLNHSFVYVPFSAGTRNCIGQKFAMLEMKTILAKVVANYKLLPAVKNRNLILQGDIVLKSANGINIRLQKR